MTKARGLADLGNVYSDGALSNRNLIINGAMQVAQRGTSTAGVNSNGYYAVDRFLTAPNTLGTWTVEQSTDAPDGFVSSLKMTCTTADASPVASANCGMTHKVEAQDLQLLGYGTPAAKDITISFWVKSNITGNATFEIQQKDNSNVQVTPQYSIVSANTWELKTIVVGGDVAGIINNDNGIGFVLRWWMNSGSDFTVGTNQTVYTALNKTDRNASNLGVGATVSDYFQITGVQLEVGDTATPFENRSYAQELALCQRFYYRRTYESFAYQYVNNGRVSGQYGTTNRSLVETFFQFPVTMRSAPTVSYPSANAFRINNDFADETVSSISTGSSSPDSQVVLFNKPSTNLNGGSMVYINRQNLAAPCWLSFDAEL